VQRENLRELFDIDLQNINLVARHVRVRLRLRVLDLQNINLVARHVRVRLRLRVRPSEHQPRRQARRLTPT